MANTTQTRKIIVSVDTNGDANLKKLNSSLGQVNKSLKQTADTLTSFKSFGQTIAGASLFGFGIREVTGIADSILLLEGRITALTGDASKTAETMRLLANVANDTKAGINEIATTYSRVAVATNRLGLSTNAMIGLTKILQQSFRLSGTTAEEAAASTLQFTQALSFGQLRGQELRSVLSQNATLAGVFSKAIEGSGKDIYKFAEAGGFTTKFILKALSENFDTIDKKANTLGQTFEQTLVIAMNKLKIAIGELNKKFGLNEAFAKFVNFGIDNIPILANVVTALAVLAIPRLIASLVGLQAALLANPFYAILSLLTFALLQTSGGVAGLAAELYTLPSALEAVVLHIGKAAIAIASLGTSLIFKDPLTKSFEKRLAEIDKFQKEVRERFKGKELIGPPEELKGVPDFAKSLKDALGNLKDPLKTVKEQIGLLNKEFNSGKIGAEEYVSKLEKLQLKEFDEDLAKGEKSLFKLREEMEKNKLANFATLLESGSLSIDEFNEKIRLFKIEQLNEKFRSGKITADELSNSLIKLQKTGFGDLETYSRSFQAGVINYISSLGTLSSQIAKVVESSFSRFEDAVIETTKGSTDAFAKMTQAILDDITRIAIRMAIIQPIASGFAGLFSPGNSVGSGTLAGLPGASTGPSLGNPGITVQPFANGGIVSSPTFFGMSGRKLGVAGEAGNEAIIPLKRGSGGQLGVGAAPVTINVINNAGAEVVTQEKTETNGSRVITMIVNKAVKDGIANGTFDRPMQQSFGLQRRGL